jgi:hypothetical protein
VTNHIIKTEGDSVPISVSFNPDDPRIVLITGKNIYRYLKLNASMQLTFAHDRLIKKDNNMISTNYTCHAWIDRKLIVCSAVGDIFLAEMSGDFKMILPSSPGP